MTKLVLLFCGLAALPLFCFPQNDLSSSDKKKLELRFKIDKQYARHKRKFYETSKTTVAYIGENIKSLMDDWGPSTRIIDNGNGEKVYIYEKEIQSSGGSVTPGTRSISSDGYSVTVNETAGTDTRYSHSYITIKDVYVVNSTITHIESYHKAFPEQRRPDAKTIFQRDLKFAGKTKEALSAKVLALIKHKNYNLRSKKIYSKKPNEIIYRNFERMCTAQECGSELYAITYVILEIDAAIIKVRVDQAMYSSLIGAKIIMNDMGQVVTENDEPFSPYSAVSVKGYEKVHPERIYDHKGNIVNRFIHDKINGYFNGYINEIEDVIK